MGSTGTGKFGNYYDTPKSTQSGINSLSNQVILLEDVALSEYYLKNKSVPKPKQKVQISDTILNGRLVVELTSNNQIIGNLPTDFNFLRLEIQNGNRFTGEIAFSGIDPMPNIAIKLYDR